MAEEQKTMLEQGLAAQAQMSQQLLDQVTQMASQGQFKAKGRGPERVHRQAIKMQKRMVEDDVKAFLNAFE